jgi:hypothetical protein
MKQAAIIGARLRDGLHAWRAETDPRSRERNVRSHAVAKARAQAERAALGAFVTAYEHRAGGNTALAVFIALVLGAIGVVTLVNADLVSVHVGLASVAAIAWAAAATGGVVLRERVRVFVHEGGMVAIRGAVERVLLYGDITQVAQLKASRDLVLKIAAGPRPELELIGRGEKFRRLVSEIVERARRLLCRRRGRLRPHSPLAPRADDHRSDRPIERAAALGPRRVGGRRRRTDHRTT